MKSTRGNSRLPQIPSTPVPSEGKDQSGREILASEGHSFLAFEDGEIKAKKGADLRIGDYLPSVKKIPTLGKGRLEGRVAELLGLYLAEGHIYVTKEKKVTHREKQWTFRPRPIAAITTSAHAYFRELLTGTTWRIVGKSRKKTTSAITYSLDASTSRWLDHRGVGHNSGEKRVPTEAYNLNKMNLKRLLKGYLLGDGTIDKRSGRHVSFTTKSRRLASDLTYLSEMLGFPCSVHVVMNRAWNSPASVLTPYFQGSSITRDGNEIALALLGQERGPIHGGGSYDTIPGIGGLLASARDQAGFTKSRVIREMYGFKSASAWGRYESGRVDISSIVLTDFVDLITEYCDNSNGSEAAKLRDILEADVFFDPVKSIEKVEPTAPFIYDRTVKGNHNFVAGPFGGIVVHNSSLSEFAAKIFEKPVVHVRESFENPSELESWMKETAKKLHLDDELLTKNLIDGVNIEYAEYSGKVHCSIAIDAAKYPNASSLKEPQSETHLVFFRQPTDQDQPEDILGFVIEHPALLGTDLLTSSRKADLLVRTSPSLTRSSGVLPLLLAHLHGP